jgi:hypothetical protein
MTPPVTLDAPNSDGWWWCRSKEDYQQGDELCVGVAIIKSENYPGLIMVRFGRDCDYLRPDDKVAGISSWFHGMEWVKAESPFATEQTESEV